MSPQSSHTDRPPAANDDAQAMANSVEYVTFGLGEQLFGLPIRDVNEVFSAAQITRVPLAPSAIRGLLNLRGRVVTAICLKTLLGVRATGATGGDDAMAIGIEHGGEQFALLVDRIGDVMRLPTDGLEPNPIHMSADWQGVSRGVHRLEGRILVVLDLATLINSERLAA
jgi:purine-binding chemotaxis protein CheW